MQSFGILQRPRPPPSLLVLMIHEWSCMQKAKHLTHPLNQKPVWIKPQPGHIKCNVDAAFFYNNETMAYGMCFRDSTCTLLFGKSDHMHCSVSVFEAESLGLLHYLKIVLIAWVIIFNIVVLVVLK